MKRSHPVLTTPEEDAEIAQSALAQNDLAHAAHHLACALAADPERPEWLALADALLDVADDPLRLVPVGEGVYAGTVALRAYALQRRGELAEAFELIGRVVAVSPEVPYHAWSRRWIERAGAKDLSPAAAEAFARAVIGAASLRLGPDAPPGVKRNLDEVLRALDTVRELHPKLGLAYYATSISLRRLGRHQDAVPVAERGYAVDPNYWTAIGLASARKDVGDPEGGRRASADALRHKPDDVPIRLDLGDACLAAGELEEAERHYREVLEREPHQPWAEASLLFVEHHRGDDEAGEKLRVLARAASQNERAQMLAHQIMPYVAYVPPPSDATANGLRELEKRGTSGHVRTGVSSLEGPSNRIAYRLSGARRGVVFEVTLSFGQIQVPDPRKPRRASRFCPWIYTASEARPAFAPPPPAVLELVADIASSPYDLDVWAEKAKALGAALGPERATELVGAMVNPPLAPALFDIPAWIAHVQIACALALSGVDGGWEGSVRREALLGVALGPMDWTTTAAVVALASVARDEPAARADVFDAFRELLDIPRPGACPYEEALDAVCRWLPETPEDIVRKLDALKNDSPLEDEKEEEAAQEEGEEKPEAAARVHEHRDAPAEGRRGAGFWAAVLVGAGLILLLARECTR